MGNRRFEDSTEREAMRRDVIDAMLTLPDDQWTVLYHRFYNGLSLAETARITAKSVDKTRQLEARALLALRRSKALKEFA